MSTAMAPAAVALDRAAATTPSTTPVVNPGVAPDIGALGIDGVVNRDGTRAHIASVGTGTPIYSASTSSSPAALTPAATIVAGPGGVDGASVDPTGRSISVTPPTGGPAPVVGAVVPPGGPSGPGPGDPGRGGAGVPPNGGPVPAGPGQTPNNPIDTAAAIAALGREVANLRQQLAGPQLPDAPGRLRSGLFGFAEGMKHGLKALAGTNAESDRQKYRDKGDKREKGTIKAVEPGDESIARQVPATHLPTGPSPDDEERLRARAIAVDEIPMGIPVDEEPIAATVAVGTPGGAVGVSSADDIPMGTPVDDEDDRSRLSGTPSVATTPV